MIKINSYDKSVIGKRIRKTKWSKELFITVTCVGEMIILGKKQGNGFEEPFWISAGDITYWELFND